MRHASALAELARVNDADIGKFKSGLDPIATAGKLGALLAQFPASFKDTPHNRDYLEWLLTTFREYPVAVELRHKTWSDQIGATLELLGAYQAAWVQIDEPKFQLSIRQNFLPNMKGLLLHAAARPERRAVVEARQVGRSLQLPLLGRRAAPLRRNRDGGRRHRPQGVPVSEQSLLGEVGRECGGAQVAGRSAGSRDVFAGDRRALPGAGGDRRGRTVYGFTDIFRMTSPTRILSGTSNPLITFPNTTYLPSRPGLAPSIT